MARSSVPAKASRLLILAAVCVVVAALYFAQDVLIPIALAVMLTFLLTPVVARLEHWGMHRVPAVALVALLTFGGIGALGWVVVDQVISLARDIPTYKENIKAKLHWLPSPGSGGLFGQLKQTATELNEVIANPSTTQTSTQAATQPAAPVDSQGRSNAPAQTAIKTAVAKAVLPTTSPTTSPASARLGASTGEAPVPVTIVTPEPSPVAIMRDNIGIVASPLGTAGVVAVFVIFMLLGREDLRDRFIRLIGYGQLTLTTQALDDATSRISRYLVAQAIVNGTYGLAIGIGLWIIGRTVGDSNPSFPNCALWGLLCALLRFIPYIGPVIASVLPIALSLAVYKGFGVFAATVAMFVIIELLSNNIMEPLLYGSSTGISTVAILVSAVFWTWLWGAAGLLLATPLTVCLVVIGKYVPQLSFLDILLGDEEVLKPYEKLYQRWLALDPEEAADAVDEFFETRSLESMYDDVLLPALALAEQDRHAGRLDDARQLMILQSIRALIDELGDDQRVRFAKTGLTTAQSPAGDEPTTQPSNAPFDRSLDASSSGQGPSAATRFTIPQEVTINVLVLPAHDEADEIVALMLSQLLEFNNYRATAASRTSLAGEMIEMVEASNAHAICVSALPPAAVTHSRYLCKRLLRKHQELKLVIGLWTVKSDLKRATTRILGDEAGHLVTTLAHAMNQIEQITHGELAQQQETTRAEAKLPVK